VMKDKLNINAIITGSTGMVGKGVLLECLYNSKVSSVLMINRSPSGIEHPKLKELIVNNFFDIGNFINELTGYNTCFFCLGTSAVGLKEKDYYRITYELTINFAEVFLSQNKNSVFCYVTGAGTDKSEKGGIMWARVKGKTENAISELAFKSSYMFRPGYIQPLKGIKSKTKSYNMIYTILSPFYRFLKLFPGLTTNTTFLGRAMINVVANEEKIKYLGNRDINRIGGK